jgi:hypothetical protein
MLQDRPLEDRVFQTIFLNKKHDETWTKHEIKQDKISAYSMCFADLFLTEL